MTKESSMCYYHIAISHDGSVCMVDGCQHLFFCWWSMLPYIYIHTYIRIRHGIWLQWGPPSFDSQFHDDCSANWGSVFTYPSPPLRRRLEACAKPLCPKNSTRGMWGFPFCHGGTPNVLIHFRLGCSLINHPVIGGIYGNHHLFEICFEYKKITVYHLPDGQKRRGKKVQFQILLGGSSQDRFSGFTPVISGVNPIFNQV